MKVYVFTFRGHWLGGTAVVIAETEEEAREQIIPGVQAIWIKPLTSNDIRLVSSHELSSPRVVYFDDGDY